MKWQIYWQIYPQYWHLVVKNGDFTFLLLEMKWQIYPLVLASSGQEW